MSLDRQDGGEQENSVSNPEQRMRVDPKTGLKRRDVRGQRKGGPVYRGLVRILTDDGPRTLSELEVLLRDVIPMEVVRDAQAARDARDAAKHKGGAPRNTRKTEGERELHDRQMYVYGVAAVSRRFSVQKPPTRRINSDQTIITLEIAEDATIGVSVVCSRCAQEIPSRTAVRKQIIYRDATHHRLARVNAEILCQSDYEKDIAATGAILTDRQLAAWASDRNDRYWKKTQEIQAAKLQEWTAEQAAANDAATGENDDG